MRNKLKKINKFLDENEYCIFFLLIIIGLIMLMGLNSFKENDYFWHIKAGKYMIQNGSILRKDVFSWSVFGKYWFSHEWLFEIGLYLISLIFPNLHVYLYVCIFSFIMMFVLFWPNRNKYLKNVYFSLLWISLLVFFIGLLFPRPHVISNIFIALTTYISMDLYNNASSRKIYFLPFIAVLWSNFHGGSSCLVYIIPMIFLIVGMFKFDFKKVFSTRINKNQCIKYGCCIVLSVLAICINPHGFKMLLYPFLNMSDSLMLGLISEWQPSNLNSVSHYPYFLLLIIIGFILIFSNKKIRFLDLALYGCGVFLGLKSMRFWMYVYIFSTFFVFDYIGERKITKFMSGFLGFFGVTLIVVALLFDDCIFRTNKILSDEMIDIIKKENPNRLCNYYDYGGYLVYNDISVFVDGRADLYSKYNLADYQDLSLMNGDYIELLEKYDFDYFLFPTDYGLSYYLDSEDKYELVLESEGVSFYKLVN